MRSRWNRCLLGLLAASLLGATCHGTGSPGDRDLASFGLSEARQVAVRAALQALDCPCGAPCAQASRGCVHAPRVLRLAAELARLGATTAEIVAEIQRYHQSFAQPAAIVAVADAPCKGPEEAPVTVAVFSDFECPACADLVPALHGLVQPGGQARVCFRYYPLDSHANSRLTAQAAEQARLAGRFWELHDLMFEHQANLTQDKVVTLGARAGLNPEVLREAVQNDRHLALVNASKADGKHLGVSGTPTAFVNGRQLTLPLLGAFLAIAVEDHAEFLRGGWTHD
jgi:protein-disulfide isomerase